VRTYLSDSHVQNENIYLLYVKKGYESFLILLEIQHLNRHF